MYFCTLENSMTTEVLWHYGFFLLVVVGVLFYIKNYATEYFKLKQQELKLLAANTRPPKNEQAHERMLLFLERIKPAYLVAKFDTSLAPSQYAYLVQKSIQQEFEYNVAQQLYISPEVWSKISNAKNWVITLVNNSLEELEASDSLPTFKTKLIMKAMEDHDKIAEAILALQNEII